MGKIVTVYLTDEEARELAGRKMAKKFGIKLD